MASITRATGLGELHPKGTTMPSDWQDLGYWTGGGQDMLAIFGKSAAGVGLRSVKTGKVFFIGWKDFYALAVGEGVELNDELPEGLPREQNPGLPGVGRDDGEASRGQAKSAGSAPSPQLERSADELSGPPGPSV
jgi:hypothetical protein